MIRLRFSSYDAGGRIPCDFTRAGRMSSQGLGAMPIIREPSNFENAVRV